MNSNDDQNLKKLTERLVAMSPEPPPFPEEVTMTTSSQSPKRSPMLVFAGAAIAVLLAIGIPLYLLANDDAPIAAPGTSTTTTVAPDETTTTQSAETTTLPEETTTTTEGAVPIPIAGDTVVFLVQEPVNSFLGDPALIPFATQVFGSPETDPTLYALQTLMPVDAPIIPPEGFSNAIPEGVEIVNARRADGAPNILILEMNDVFLEGAGGLLGDFTMLNQIIYTATVDPDIDEVQFIVDNQPVTEFGSEGLDLSSSVNRETFQDNLALIYLTSPILPNGDGNVVVEGMANTYEASLSVRVLDAQGEVVHQEFGTATCGSGCWGDYLFVLDSDLFDADSSVQLLEFSAEDGQPQNIITIPFNDGMLWDLSPEA